MPSTIQKEVSSLSAIATMRPMLMITGFLGAGKTTLLRSILNHLSNKNHLADVILNDRENAAIDQQALIDEAASVSALTGSCVCCEGLNELCDMVLKASKSPHEVLFIEFNGTADPLPLQETFTLLESKFLLQPRWQVCVIDCRHFGKRGYYDELEQLQLETASHYVLSHTSNATQEEIVAIDDAVKTMNPLASRTNASDLAEALSQSILNNHRFVCATKENHSELPVSLTKPSLQKSHLHSRHQIAHEFTGCNIIFPSVVEASRVVPWLEKLPASVIRAKALMVLDSKPDQRYLYERVGMEVSPYPNPIRSISKAPCSGLFIGPDLEPDVILQITRETLHPDCHFPES